MLFPVNAQNSLVDRVDNVTGRPLAVVSHDLEGTFIPEEELLRIVRLHHPVGEQEDGSPGSTVERRALGEVGIIDEALTVRPCSQSPTAPRRPAQDKALGVTGAAVGKQPGLRVEAGQCQGNEAAIVDVGGEDTIEEEHDVADPGVGEQERPQVARASPT